MRCVLTRANGQPAVAAYTRKPGDTVFEPLAVDVLQVQNGVITEITTFDRACSITSTTPSPSTHRTVRT
jgi:hypothetical protein